MPHLPRINPAANSATTRAFVQWIRSAAPYIHAFRGKTFVIAFGGEVVADDTFLGIVHDLNLLHSLGIRLVVVHGSRPQIEAILKQQNIRSVYNRGLRVTDAETLDCVLEGTGQARSRIEALLSLGVANSPMAGARIRVVGGNFLTAKPIGVLDGVDMQWTGEVRRVDVEAIRQRLDDGDIVLVSPLGYSPTGEIFNLALEEVATQVAVQLSAHKLIFLMETDGVRNGRRQLLTELSTRDAEALLAKRAKLPRDVQHYLPCAIRACDNGVKRAHLDHPPPRRRAAARALHARRRRHDGRGRRRSRICAARRSTTSAASWRSSSRWRTRASWCAARASAWRWKSSASSSPSTTA